MRRMLCVELPEEDKTEIDRVQDNVGLLNLSLHGTHFHLPNISSSTEVSLTLTYRFYWDKHLPDNSVTSRSIWRPKTKL